jgi:multicomponent Na+:H+ antiporter subunit F
LFASIRLVRGPTQIDRAVALDVLLAIVVGVIVLMAAATDSSITLVIAVVVSLLGFLGSASLAKLLPRDRQ